MGNNSYGAGLNNGKEDGWIEAKQYFKEKTGIEFDDICDACDEIKKVISIVVRLKPFE